MQIPPIEPFAVEGAPSAQAPRWKEWVERVTIFFEDTKVEEDQRRALILHLGRKDIYKISKIITEATPKTHITLIDALNAYFEPMANIDYRRFVFRQARQKPEESLDTFHGRLKELASSCGFADEMEEIRGQVIQGCASAKLRERILEESGKSLIDILVLGRSKELSKDRAAHMEAALQHPIKAEPVNTVCAVMPHPEKGQEASTAVPRKKQCGYCGGLIHRILDCPARGKKCTACGKFNHFMKVCRSTARKPSKAQVNTMTEAHTHSSDMDDDGEEHTVHSVFMIAAAMDTMKKLPTCAISIGGQKSVVIVDTGATINIMAETEYRKMDPRPALRPS